MKTKTLTYLLSIAIVLLLSGSIFLQTRFIELQPGESLTVHCDEKDLSIEPKDSDEVILFCGDVHPTQTVTTTRTAVRTTTATRDTTHTITSTPIRTQTRTVTSSPTALGAPVTQTPSVTIGVPTHTSEIPVNPSQSVQEAINNAPAGAVIRLQDGTYNQNFKTVRDGLTIVGSRSAVVHGAGDGNRAIEINHNSVRLEGFTIDGAQGNNKYAGRLVYILGVKAKIGVNNVIIRNMELRNAGGECIRLRYYVQNSIVENNVISNCGRVDFPNGEWAGGGKNGEGVYIGTAPEQQGDGKNPESGPDKSTANVVRNNTFNTQGNECVDIKENSILNYVQNNTCTGNKDENAGGMGSRSNDNIFTGNTIFGNVGAGIRLGGDTSDQGIQNTITGNVIRDNRNGGIRFQARPQRLICGNTMSNNTGGNSAGTYGSDFSPTASCP